VPQGLRPALGAGEIARAGGVQGAEKNGGPAGRRLRRCRRLRRGPERWAGRSRVG